MAPAVSISLQWHVMRRLELWYLPASFRTSSCWATISSNSYKRNVFLSFFKESQPNGVSGPSQCPTWCPVIRNHGPAFQKQTNCIAASNAWFIHSPPHDMPDQTQQKTGWADIFAKITFNLVSRSFWRKQECSKLHQNASNRSVIHGKCVWSSTRLIFARNVRSRKMFRCQESWRLLAQNNLYFFVDTFVC